MPTKREEIFRNMPFRFLGAENGVNPRTIAQVHDRTAVLEMKHFWSHNASNNKPLKEIRSATNEIGHDICWDDPENMQHIHDALSNYVKRRCYQIPPIVLTESYSRNKTIKRDK